MLGDQKIVILMDDLDRCTKETIKYAMKLFSEIMLLPKSIIVFVGDYRQLLDEDDLKKGFFDKYFTYNYNLCTIPYNNLLEYYRDVYALEELQLPSVVKVPEYIEGMLERINTICSQNEQNSVAYKEGLAHGSIRDVAISQEILLSQNLTAGINKIKERLSNSRKVIRIYKEIYDQLKRIRIAIEVNGSNCSKSAPLLRDTVYPAVMFYSLARTICTDDFWEMCADDFAGFEDDIERNLRLMQVENLADEKKGEEKLVYAALVYYHFSEDIWGKNVRAQEFKNFYLAASVKKYLFEE